MDFKDEINPEDATMKIQTFVCIIPWGNNVYVNQKKYFIISNRKLELLIFSFLLKSRKIRGNMKIL